MLQKLFFYLGLVNNILLIIIFAVRKKVDLRILRRVGTIYLFLALPAAFGIYLAVREPGAARYAIFLGIFLAFLALEGIYDFVLKVPFRENWDWRLLTPYLMLYYAMNYGFVVMVWKTSLAGGILMLVLFVVQIVLNIITHPRKRADRA